jgi:hypothetical protein
MLTVACKPVRYQVLAAEADCWSPTHDLILNYNGISQQLSGCRTRREGRESHVGAQGLKMRVHFEVD